MAYEIVKSINKLIDLGIGDVARLEYILDRLEKGKDLYFSDKNYLENLLYTNNAAVNEQTESKTESQSLEKIDAELKSLNAQLENILKNKQSTTKIKPDHDISKVQAHQKSKSDDENIIIHRKSDELTLVLAVVLGLISLQGIGHIYIGKIARGVGILVLSLLLTSLCVSYVIGIMPQSHVLSFMSILFPLLIIGYFGLYIFQVLDSRKLCVAYNEYITTKGKKPLWW